MAEKLSKALNIEVSYNEVTPISIGVLDFREQMNWETCSSFYRDFDEGMQLVYAIP
jgi:hypothetical protein